MCTFCDERAERLAKRGIHWEPPKPDEECRHWAFLAHHDMLYTNGLADCFSVRRKKHDFSEALAECVDRIAFLVVYDESLLNSPGVGDHRLTWDISDYVFDNTKQDSSPFWDDPFEIVASVRKNPANGRALQKTWKSRSPTCLSLTPKLIRVAESATDPHAFFDQSYGDECGYQQGYGTIYLSTAPSRQLEKVNRRIRALLRSLKRVKLWPLPKERDEWEEDGLIYSATVLGSPDTLKKMVAYQKGERKNSRDSSNPPDATSS